MKGGTSQESVVYEESGGEATINSNNPETWDNLRQVIKQHAIEMMGRQSQQAKDYYKLITGQLPDSRLLEYEMDKVNPNDSGAGLNVSQYFETLFNRVAELFQGKEVVSLDKLQLPPPIKKQPTSKQNSSPLQEVVEEEDNDDEGLRKTRTVTPAKIPQPQPEKSPTPVPVGKRLKTAKEEEQDRYEEYLQHVMNDEIGKTITALDEFVKQTKQTIETTNANGAASLFPIAIEMKKRAK